MRFAQVDVAIIGAGTAGLAAYRAVRTAGASAILIEGGADGTTCARVGCMPSKLLIAAAEAARAVETAPGFGVHLDGVIRIDGRAVMGRVRRERDRFVGLVLRDVERIAETDRLRGHASFVDDHTLEVGGHTRVVARTVIIATGSHATREDTFDTLGDRVIGSDEVFDWQDLPKSVAVIGPGIVGLELGQALHRLGVHVAILGRGGRVGPIGDPEILDYAIAAFKQEFTLEPDAHIADIRRDGERVAIDRTTPEDQGRARILLRNKGLMNVYAETASGRFLGAEMLAPGGEHLAHLLAWALQNRMTIEQMLEMPYYHPVLEEGLRTALHDVNAKLRAARRAGSDPARARV
jgi:dihydrolipoamide dehydrogenase